LSQKVIEVISDAGHIDTFKSIAEQNEVTDFWYSLPREDGRCTFKFLVFPEQRQVIMDSVQNVLGGSEKSRVLILPVEAVWPYPVEKEGEKGKSIQTTREELYTEIEKGARLDSNYFLLVFLSTVVVAIGLIEDNVAVVIGAMVIAPLLGPNIAFGLAAALGDRVLIGKALSAGAAGISFAFVLTWVLGIIWHGDVSSPELMTRTTVGLDSVALALASGTAAALSITTGLSSVLVGVMVAVALLPPTATAGIMLGVGKYNEFIGASMLLAVNIVCVNLSAKLVFLFKGVRPRTWLEKKKARQSFTLFLLIWIISLGLLLVIIYYRYLRKVV
jgi:uncharacterized hydrophobic protein (TIGR00341 family)